MHIRNQTDVAAGGLYVAIALAFGIGANDLTIGTASNMGPGYFPVGLSVLLALVGIVVLLTGFLPNAPARSLERWRVKKLALVIGSILIFAAVLPRGGLLLAIMAMVITSSLASDEFTWRAAALNAVVLAAMGAAIFVYALGLNLALWPRL